MVTKGVPPLVFIFSFFFFHFVTPHCDRRLTDDNARSIFRSMSPTKGGQTIWRNLTTTRVETSCGVFFFCYSCKARGKNGTFQRYSHIFLLFLCIYEYSLDSLFFFNYLREECIRALGLGRQCIHSRRAASNFR